MWEYQIGIPTFFISTVYIYRIKVIEKLGAVFGKVIIAAFVYHNTAVVKHQRMFIAVAVNNRQKVRAVESFGFFYGTEPETVAKL